MMIRKIKPYITTFYVVIFQGAITPITEGLLNRNS